MFSFKDLALKLLLLYGFLIIFGFIVFRAFFINLSPYIVVISILLLLAELHNSLQFMTMLYSLWPRKYKEYKQLNKNKNAKINIFICVCGEPAEIVRNTIAAAIKARDQYVKRINPTTQPNIVVLNDGYAAKKENWEDIKSLSRELGVMHVARSKASGFKAGNLNNGFAKTKTSDPDNTYDVVLDADFAVIPEFLLEITKPFSEKDIDFVQTPQRYSNETTWVAQAAAAHQIHFFEHVCPAKAYDNALFLCGTNFAIRRSALNAVGGMDERFITEDFATSLNLHLNGKKGTFIKKPLAYGIAPSSLKAYFGQQRRWSKGTFDTSRMYAREILFGNLTKRQRFQYIISSIYYLSGLRNIIFMLAPLPYLLFGTPLMNVDIPGFFMLVYAPLFIYNFLVYFLLFKHPLKSWILDTISFPIFISAFFSSMFGKKLGFVVTIKQYQKENIFIVYKTQIIVAITLAIGLAFALINNRVAYSLGQYINYFWVIFNTCILALGFYLFLKDNYITGFDGVNTSPKARARFVTAVELMVFIPVFLGLLAMVARQNPSVRNLMTQGIVAVQAFEEKTTYKLLLPSNGVYYGYYKPEFNSMPNNPDVNIAVGEKPSLAMFYSDWDSNSIFNIEFMNKLAGKNVIPVVTWEPWSSSDAQNGDLKQSNYSPKLIAGGKYDSYIRAWARNAASYKKPYFLRFAHEMNGNWYSWGTIDGNSSQDYKNMWIHVHNIFKEEGATNTIWLWSPNNEDNTGSSESVLSFYPGDEYVDWVGYSGFNWGDTTTSDWRSFEGLTLNIYPYLNSLNKPIMVAETSTVGNSIQKSKWIHELSESLAFFGKIKAVVFYDDNFNNSNFKLSTTTNIESVINENITQNEYFVKDPILVEVKK